MAHPRVLPTGRARLNMRHPSLRGATLAMQIGPSAVGFAANGQQVYQCTGGTPVVTPLGMAQRTNSVSSAIFTTASDILGASATTSYTLLVIGTASNSGIYSAVDHDNSSTRRFQFRLNNGKVELIIFDGGNGLITTLTAPAAMSAADSAAGFLMMATVEPKRIAIVQNSTVVEAAISTAAGAPSSGLWIGARQAGNQGWTTGGLSYVIIWPRAMATAELQTIAADWTSWVEWDDDFDIPAATRVSASTSTDISAGVAGVALTAMAANIATVYSVGTTCSAISSAGLPASVVAPYIVMASARAQTAGGLVAVVSIATNIDTGTAGCSATSWSASIALPNIVSGACPNLAATGLHASIVLPSVIAAASGAPASVGLTATISTDSGVACATASAGMIGLPASVSQPTVVMCSGAGGQSNVGLPAQVAAATMISAAAASVSTGGLPASVPAGPDIVFASAGVHAFGLSAGIVVSTVINCGASSGKASGEAAQLLISADDLVANPKRTYLGLPRVRVYVAQKRVREL